MIARAGGVAASIVIFFVAVVVACRRCRIIGFRAVVAQLAVWAVVVGCAFFALMFLGLSANPPYHTHHIILTVFFGGVVLCVLCVFFNDN